MAAKKKKELVSTKETPQKKIGLFDFLNSINDGTRGDDYLIDCFADTSNGAMPDSVDKAYIPFMINRGLSFFNDTIFYANAMNERASLPVKMQFDFLRHALRPRKRFAKWAKKADDTADVELIMAKYNYSSEKARDAYKLYTEGALIELRNSSDVGGSGKKIK